MANWPSQSIHQGGYMGLFDKKSDDVQGLANFLGRDLFVGTSGMLQVDPKEAINENIRIEQSGANKVTGGNCGQDPNNVSSGNSNKKS